MSEPATSPQPRVAAESDGNGAGDGRGLAREARSAFELLTRAAARLEPLGGAAEIAPACARLAVHTRARPITPRPEFAPAATPSRGTPRQATPSRGTPAQSTPARGMPARGTSAHATPTAMLRAPVPSTPGSSPSEAAPRSW